MLHNTIKLKMSGSKQLPTEWMAASADSFQTMKHTLLNCCTRFENGAYSLNKEKLREDICAVGNSIAKIYKPPADGEKQYYFKKSNVKKLKTAYFTLCDNVQKDKRIDIDNIAEDYIHLMETFHLLYER